MVKVRIVLLGLSGRCDSLMMQIKQRGLLRTPLNKTAWAGTYPDWGRIMDAIDTLEQKLMKKS